MTRGTAVLPCRGTVVRAERIADDCMGMQIGHGLYLVADPQRQDPSDFVNHGCEPNVGFTDGDLWFHALRDVAVGEELLWDYSTSMNEPGWSVPCRCGSARCRGTIQSFCDLSPHHQEALRGIALRYLR